MAKPRQTGSKRQRERAKLEQKQEKARRKAARRQDAEERRASVESGVDPDWCGIVAGPQPKEEDEVEQEDADRAD